MGTNAEGARTPLTTADNTADDADLLQRLSEVLADLLRYRQEASAARTHLRVRRTRIAQVDAILSADTSRLVALRGDGRSDRVTIDLLEDAVAGGRSAYESATRDSTRAENAIRSLLRRLSHKITSLERDEEALRERLSAAGARTYELLTRRNILPLVAYLADGSCGECRWTIATTIARTTARTIARTIATPIVLKNGLHRCPYCSRVLVQREPGIPSLR